MNSQQKFEENNTGLDEVLQGDENTSVSRPLLKDYKYVEGAGFFKKTHIQKPDQYQIGIDTFARMEANCNKEEILAFCKGNIDKYTWRTKGCDLEDFKKIIDYANFAIKQLEKNG